jgi:sugar/nucleoside kinase (ribokinase family)
MLGIETGFIGSIGRDETGDFFERDMKAAGVNTMLIKRSTLTGTAVALISPDSERTFATHLGAAVELHANDLNSELFRGYDILYLEGYLISDPALVEKACLLAKENRMTIALDLASYNVVEYFRDAFKKIVTEFVDILFANEMEAEAFTGIPSEQALNLLSGQGKL